MRARHHGRAARDRSADRFRRADDGNRAQAEERADPARGDKGYEAAVAAATVAVIERKRDKKRMGFR